MALLFEDAAKAKNAIMASQQKEIAKLYDDWANDIADRAKFYSHKTTASAPLSERYYRELHKQMKTTSQFVSDEVAGIIKGNMYTIADSVVADNVKWLQSFGFSPDGLNAAFSYIPHDVVQMLITGQVYQGGWNLSQRIWSDNQQTQRDIYQIMARGLAEQKPIYNIAKDLESYVRPGAKKAWNPILAMKNTKTGKIEYKRIYKKQVDYNAQRLARTLAQHTYQQSFIATTKDNPFITEYIWHSNGSRVCELCMDRDGKHFKKNELPMDHPNGMCTMEPAVAEDMVDQLADWFNSPDGTYPEIDAFAGNFGYVATKTGNNLSIIKEKFGNSIYSDKMKLALGDNYNEGKKLIISEYNKSGYQSTFDFLDDYYNGKIKSPKLDELFGNKSNAAVATTSKGISTVDDFIKKYGTSTKSPNAWYNGLTPEQKAEAKFLKEQSGLNWNDWYKQNIYAGDGSNLGGTKTKVVQAFSDAQSKYLSPYGFSPDNMPKNFDDWSHKLSYSQADEILKSMGTSLSDPHPYQQLMKYYNTNLASSNFVSQPISATKAATKTATKKVATKTTTSTAAKIVDKADDALDTTSWITKFRGQSESHMLDLEKDSMKLIGRAGQNGIKTYSGSSYTTMNSYLRYLQQGYSETDAVSMSGISPSKLKAVKNAMSGLDNARLTEDLVLRRGTDLGDLAGAFMSGDFRANKSSLYGKAVQELNDMFAGAVGQYGSFTSTSSIWDRGFYGDVEVVLYAPKGTSASSIMSISQFGTSEGETLLNAGTTVKCVKIEKSDGHKGSDIRVFMEIIPK